jgi:hypothetical protein
MLKQIFDNPWKSLFGTLILTGCVVDIVEAATGNNSRPSYIFEFGGNERKPSSKKKSSKKKRKS